VDWRAKSFQQKIPRNTSGSQFNVTIPIWFAKTAAHLSRAKTLKPRTEDMTSQAKAADYTNIAQMIFPEAAEVWLATRMAYISGKTVHEYELAA